MNFTNKYNIQIFEDFLQLYSQKIDTFWPELKGVIIDVYDKDSAQLKDYIINHNVHGDLSGNIDSLFQCYPNYEYNNQTYNDIIMRGDLCQKANLTQQEQFALIAHEIGHFVSAYSNTGFRGQKDECYADDMAAKLGLRKDLVSALQKCMTILPEQNSTDPFLNMLQQQHDSVKNMKVMLQERIDRL